MWTVFKRNPLAVLLAVALHVILAVLLLANWQRDKPPAAVTAAVVQAKAVDAGKLQQELQRREDAETRKEQEKLQAERREQERQEQALKKREAEQQRQAEEKKQRELEAKRQAEEKKRQAELEKQRQVEAEKKRREEAQRKAEAEKQRLETERRKKAEAERLRQEEEKRKQAEAEAEKKRQAEEVKRKAEEAKRQAEEAKRKAQEEAKRKAEAERRAAEARVQAAQAAREAELRAAIDAEQRAGEVSRYRVAIQQRIEDRWTRPPNTGGLKCTLEVRLIPGGDVLSVRVIESSGNPAFDRSVENAVRRAAPLPVPSGGLFEDFRTLRFVFDPRS